jgi:hypothetical protein
MGIEPHVRSLGSSYSAIELRPLSLNLVDYTPLSDSRSSLLISLFSKIRQNPVFLENIDFLPVAGYSISPLQPGT